MTQQEAERMASRLTASGGTWRAVDDERGWKVEGEQDDRVYVIWTDEELGQYMGRAVSDDEIRQALNFVRNR